MTAILKKNNPSTYEKDLRAKIDVLCNGIRSSDLVESIYKDQNPFNHFRTGNAGLQLLIGDNNLVANVPVGQKYCEASSYTLARESGAYCLYKDDKFICQCKPISAPKWYLNTTSDNVEMGKILLLEGKSTLITAIINFCDYFNSNSQCAFCAINYCAQSGGNLIKKTARQIAETVKEAVSEMPNATLDLTGGNIDGNDHGAKLYFDVIKEIRIHSDIPICAEISPPESSATIEKLVELGANAFMMNLEIYDEKLRQLFMPGKAKIPREKYFQSYELALRLVGKSKVSSVLIVGLESKSSTLQGAKRLIELGVIPTIMPLRPNNGSLLENFSPPNPDDVYEISQEVGRMLIQNKLNPWSHPGCISCMACSVEADFAFRENNIDSH